MVDDHRQFKFVITVGVGRTVVVEREPIRQHQLTVVTTAVLHQPIEAARCENPGRHTQLVASWAATSENGERGSFRKLYVGILLEAEESAQLADEGGDVHG